MARIHHNYIQSDIQSRKEKLYKEIEAVTIEELSTAVHNVPARCELVVDNDGSHIEQFLYINFNSLYE